MLKTDMKELKKHLKKATEQDGIIDWVFGAYISNEGEQVWSSAQKFYDFDDEDKFRLYGVINKVLPNTIGKKIYPVGVEQQTGFLNLRENWEGSAPGELVEQIRSNYSSADPYYIMVARILYDVPTKASDGAVLEDESSMYDGLVFALCPVKLSTPALGYEGERIANLNRRWTVGAPMCGFLYPSFNDRLEDRNEVVIYKKNEEAGELFENFFEFKEDLRTSEEQQMEWNELLSEFNLSTDTAGVINDAICDLSSKHNITELGRVELKTILEAAEVDTKDFDGIYDKTVTGSGLAIDAISSSKVEIKTDTSKIHTDSEMATLIKTEMIDGVPYILVPADGVITVNGTQVKL